VRAGAHACEHVLPLAVGEFYYRWLLLLAVRRRGAVFVGSGRTVAAFGRECSGSTAEETAGPSSKKRRSSFLSVMARSNNLAHCQTPVSRGATRRVNGDGLGGLDVKRDRPGAPSSRLHPGPTTLRPACSGSSLASSVDKKYQSVPFRRPLKRTHSNSATRSQHHAPSGFVFIRAAFDAGISRSVRNDAFVMIRSLGFLIT
jgi:hypothetical protein